MSELNYCANGCTRRNGDQNIPATTEGPSRLCNNCEDRLYKWLTAIPNKYALLPTFLEHGAVERNPDSKATKGSVAAAPMRLEIIDLLDTRRGRKWQGLTPADDRRGVVGYLKIHIENVIDGRQLTGTKPITTVAAACDFLNRHRLWIAEQDWVDDTYDDIRVIHRDLSDAIGDYRPKPVGRCHLVTDTQDTCGGSLFASTYGGVRCVRCGATWEAEELRRLGLAQAQDTA